MATLREAARRASTRGASESAVAYLRRALDEPPAAAERAELLVELGSAETRVSGEAAVEHLQAARELIDDPVKKAEIALLLGRQLYLLGGEESDAVLTQALADLDGADPELERLLQAGLITDDLFAPALQDHALELLEPVRRPAADTLGEKVLLSLLAHYDARTGRPAAEVVPVARRALGEGALVRDDVSGTFFIPPVTVLAMADLDEALVIFEDALAEAHRRGSTFAFAAAKVFRLRDACVARRPPRGGVRGPRGACRWAEAWGATARFYGHASAFLADALMEQGRLDDATAALAQRRFRESLPDSERVLFCRQQRAAAHPAWRLAGGLRSSCSKPAGASTRSEATTRRSLPGARRRRSPCSSSAERTRPDSWRQKRWSTPATGELRARCAGALRAAGLVEGGERGLALLEEAVGVVDGSPAKLEHAQGAHRARSGAAAGQSPRRGARAPSASRRAGDDLRGDGARRHAPNASCSPPARGRVASL